ncbi:retrovirus-related pol polyprotein from transposon TNT 1-94, partial [Tanacetum coccineum]
KDYRIKYKGLKAEIYVLTKKIDAMNKGNSEKGLVTESFDWDEESVSSNDEEVTTSKALMAIVDEEQSVGRADDASDERRHVLDYTHVDLHYVEDQRKNLLNKYNSLKQEFSLCKSELTDLKNIKALNSSFKNKITKLCLENESLKDEIFDLKKFIEKWTSSRVTLDQLVTEQVPGNIVRALGGKGIRKDKISSKEVVFTKSDVSSFETSPEIPSDSESEGDTQIPLPSLPKLIGAKPLDYLKRYVWYLDSGCSRQMIRVKQYLHIYSKESGPKVVFGDNSSGDIEGYGLVNCNGITFTKVAYVTGLKHNLISISQLCNDNFILLFTKTQGTIFNQNNKIILIAPRRRDVYIIDMTSYNEESNVFFFAKASPSVNWLWHKRLSHLNFKNINKLAKQNLVAGLPPLTFSKDKTCSACEKRKHHRASFKTKRSFSINKCLHLLHVELFGPVKPQFISHNKYTLVIVDE